MRVLLIGHGFWGSKLRGRFDTLLGSESVLVVELDGAKLPANLPTRVYLGDFRNLLDKVDACVIATPPASHYEIAKACLEAGKHCLVEKPLTMDPYEAEELLQLAESKGLTLMSDDTWLYHDGVEPTLLHRGPYAFALYIVWANPRLQTPDEGILWTLGPHPISLTLEMMQERPDRVVGAYTGRTLNVSLHFPSGATAEMFLTWQTQERVRRFSGGALFEDGCHFTLFDDGLMPPQKEPLRRMCEVFLSRLGQRWLDRRAVNVVQTLAFIEGCITPPWLRWPEPGDEQKWSSILRPAQGGDGDASPAG
jgi:predicted dehydrogenase